MKKKYIQPNVSVSFAVEKSQLLAGTGVNFGPGENKFTGIWSYTKGEIQLSYSESLGLGSTKYKLVEI